MRTNNLFILFAAVIVILTGCQSSANTVEEIQMKSEEEQQQILDGYTYEDYKKVFEESVSETDSLEADAQLKKWVIRTLAQEKLYYETDLTDKQVIEISKEAMQEDQVWKTIAKDEYGVSVTEEEIDTFIEQGPDTSELPQHLAYADALDLSLEELNHNFDRDIYERNVIWLKLIPELKKKYDITKNNELVEKYEEEVEAKLEGI
ncbi:hypothetical protein [Jeotgalibacillus terrae]|uniref:Uncharacterized protein n=1 Tax=Jeotgalibacillus terrae TaxID=587735 RepID=A0ABW5ZKI1_9BACL|nr:hypothetical protein [Jeotgalibacillus terrae]MBM7578199.1 hypothetical protein [Jeotgalibacillus terrae]